MDKELKDDLISAARENGAKHGKTAELDFGAGAEWLFEKLKSHNSDKTICPKCNGTGIESVTSHGVTATGNCLRCHGTGHIVLSQNVM